MAEIYGLDDASAEDVSKEEANYRPSDGDTSCGNCAHFTPTGDGTGTCSIVDGEISEDHVSDYFEPSSTAQLAAKLKRRKTSPSESLTDKFIRLAGRIYVPPHPSVVRGKPVRVEGYWRRAKPGENAGGDKPTAGQSRTKGMSRGLQRTAPGNTFPKPFIFPHGDQGWESNYQALHAENERRGGRGFTTGGHTGGALVHTKNNASVYSTGEGHKVTSPLGNEVATYDNPSDAIEHAASYNLSQDRLNQIADRIDQFLSSGGAGGAARQLRNIAQHARNGNGRGTMTRLDRLRRSAAPASVAAKNPELFSDIGRIVESSRGFGIGPGTNRPISRRQPNPNEGPAFADTSGDRDATAVAEKINEESNNGTFDVGGISEDMDYERFQSFMDMIDSSIQSGDSPTVIIADAKRFADEAGTSGDSRGDYEVGAARVVSAMESGLSVSERKSRAQEYLTKATDPKVKAFWQNVLKNLA